MDDDTPAAPSADTPAEQPATNQEVVGRPIPLPATVEDMLAMRKTMLGRTLNDHVEDLHTKMWTDPKYRALLEAVYPEDAVEGSLPTDDTMAAIMIREQGRKDRNPFVQGRKLSTIVKALHVVLRRYGLSRKERALTIGGHRVPNDNE